MKKETDWAKKLQERINEIARIIDDFLPCLATGVKTKNIQAGHVYSRGSNCSAAFNLHNIHRQCSVSNNSHNNDLKMREGLKREYGVMYLEFVGKFKTTPVLKLSNHEYKDYYQRANTVAKRLRKKDYRIPKDTRIKLRNEINQYIGIYSEDLCVFKED